MTFAEITDEELADIWCAIAGAEDAIANAKATSDTGVTEARLGEESRP
jgi:hypothetical protein